MIVVCPACKFGAQKELSKCYNPNNKEGMMMKQDYDLTKSEKRAEARRKQGEVEKETIYVGK